MSKAKPNDPLLTTHQVAQLLGAEPSSVIRWYDKGILTGWRTPGGHRRIRASSVRAYLRSKNIPIPVELGGVEDAPPVRETKPSTGLRRLMWVDDDASFLLGVSRALRAYEDQVESMLLDDPIEALVELAGFQPHMLVLDVRMPGLDGLQVCRSLKHRDDCDDLAIMLVSGHLDDDTIAMAKEAGANAVLNKPVTIEQVLEPLGVLTRTRSTARP
jgi:excisionase family DNA binding protein